MYVALGTLLTSFITDPIARPQISSLLLLLVLSSLAFCFLRCLILDKGTPRDYTLFTLGQLWAIPSLVSYEIAQHSSGAAVGIYIHSLKAFNFVIACTSVIFVAAFSQLLTRSSLPTRLVAFTESPQQYRLVFGPSLKLALQVETCALICYLLAGVAFRFVISDISGGVFGTESIWCLLSIALINRRWQSWVIAGPVSVTLTRLLINRVVDPRYSFITTYGLLAASLAILNITAKRVSREAAN